MLRVFLLMRMRKKNKNAAENAQQYCEHGHGLQVQLHVR